MANLNSADALCAVHRGISIYRRKRQLNRFEQQEVIEFFCDVNDGQRVWEIVSKTPGGVIAEIDITLNKREPEPV